MAARGCFYNRWKYYIIINIGLKLRWNHCSNYIYYSTLILKKIFKFNIGLIFNTAVQLHVTAHIGHTYECVQCTDKQVAGKHPFVKKNLMMDIGCSYIILPITINTLYFIMRKTRVFINISHRLWKKGSQFWRTNMVQHQPLSLLEWL